MASLINSSFDQYSVSLMKKPLFSSLSKPVRLALYYFMGVIGLSFVGAFWLHYELWGYWFERPPLLDSAKTIAKVERLMFVRTPDCREPERCSFAVDPDITLSRILNNSYYDELYERLPRYLQSTGKLPSSFDADMKGVVDLYKPMMQTPLIAKPSEGFTNHNMSGLILIGETSTGEKRAFISAIGRQIGDEYAPYYEAIFKIGAKGQSVQYLEGQRFFYDTDFDEATRTVIYVIFLVVIFGCIPMLLIIYY
ncbi:hypothetical protein [Acaryochloris marina]|uniref:hypothetical protein n=1 Tax=Acaryochloris marina TaxID=155978 RepID=UPI0021C4528F|nr:hypothetical protein [Acaryochloris marina]BDM83653.1 hypothetical protein AM10699_65140 [Acaryochloris marina MBIC10699]